MKKREVIVICPMCTTKAKVNYNSHDEETKCPKCELVWTWQLTDILNQEVKL